jgi:hypothetical protein
MRKLLVRSKTLCLVMPNDTVAVEVTEKLTAWGRLTLVPSFPGADLIMEIARAVEPLKTISEFRDEGFERGTAFTARVWHRRSGVELWSTSKGANWRSSEPDGAWSARQITEEFEKFFDNAAGGGLPRK